MGDLSRRYKYPNNFRSFCCPKRSHVANEERGNMKWNIKAVSDFAIWGPQRECIYKTPCKRPEGKKHMAVILISNSLCQVLRLPEHIDCKTFMIHTELIGQSCILCIKRTCMGRKRTRNTIKAKLWWTMRHATVLQTFVSRKEEETDYYIQLPQLWPGPTYLVSHRFQNVCS